MFEGICNLIYRCIYAVCPSQLLFTLSYVPSLKFRIIIVLKFEVLQTDCVMVGNPKWYPFGNLKDKSEELDAESVSGSCKMNFEAMYSAGQGLKEFLTTRGVVAVLQQPVMQVVDVSMMRSELKTFEIYHLILSDGAHKQDATLATHLNHLVKNTLLRKGTTVRLLEFMCTSQRPRCK
jgi:hypothetical protein